MVDGIVDGVSARGDGGEVHLDGGLGSYATGLGGPGGAIRGRCYVPLGRVGWWGLALARCPSAVPSNPLRRGGPRAEALGGPSGLPPWFVVGRCAGMLAGRSLGGSPGCSGHIRIGSIHSMGGWQLD